MSNPEDEKREKPSFKVKQIDTEASFSQNNQQKRFHSCSKVDKAD
jgi:hypothetical protein